MERCLILSARQFNFTGKDGKQREGVTITYLTGDVESSGETLGCPPLSLSGPPELWRDLRALPGFYELELRQRPGAGGRTTVHLAGVHFKEPAGLFPTTEQPAPKAA